jgi:outer membrane protein assembly factor BamE (lipoprotein component of BamABCDE complex)
MAVGMVALLACTTRGSAFDPDSVVRIEPGYSTQEHVRRIFGNPVALQTTAYGQTKWQYLYEETRRKDTRTLTKIGRSVASIFGIRVYLPPVDVAYETTIRHELHVLFGPDGIVEDYAYNRREIPSRRIY